jgi:hypothetical protein
VQDLLRATLAKNKPKSKSNENTPTKNGNTPTITGNTTSGNANAFADDDFDPSDFLDANLMDNKKSGSNSNSNSNNDDKIDFDELQAQAKFDETEFYDPAEEFMDVGQDGSVIPREPAPKNTITNNTKNNTNNMTNTTNTTKGNNGGDAEDEDKNADLLARDEVQISTVDAFQGAEKGNKLFYFSSPLVYLLIFLLIFLLFLLIKIEIIILTCSRTDRLGFSDSPNRLNVAITRARR